jgi:hypothetical protein
VLRSPARPLFNRREAMEDSSSVREDKASCTKVRSFQVHRVSNKWYKYTKMLSPRETLFDNRKFHWKDPDAVGRDLTR